MTILTATQSTWFLIGPIAKLLGYIMNGIFEGLNYIGLPSIGLSIILFTLIVKALMIPLSIRQQKFSKLQAVMQPELQAIQKKYKGAQDQASLIAQQQETRAVYAKYGTSATGGCLQLIIQMPILFALYQVIYHMPGYITKLKEYYSGIADVLMGIPGYEENADLLSLVTANGVKKAEMIFPTAEKAKDYIIDMLYNFNPDEWNKVLTSFNSAALANAYNAVREKIDAVNMFLGINLTMTPTQQLWPGIFIPVLAGLLQWLSSKMMQTRETTQKKDENNAQSMTNTMNVVFPLMSVVFCFMFSSGIGVYWVASSGVQCIIQLFVNNYIKKVDLNEMVAKNIEKINAKRAKKGLKPIKPTNVSTVVHNIEEEQKAEEQLKKSIADKAKVSSEYYARTTTAKKGSLAEKAGMVQQYEDRIKEMKKQGKN